MFNFLPLKNFLKQNWITLKIGLLTGLCIFLFEMINQFVIFRHVRLDYYLSLVAVVFLLTGIWISKKNIKPQINGQQNLLTVKEMQILQLIASGKTNKEIAAVHFVELSTVKTHINNIYAKLSIRSRKEACAWYDETVKKPVI